MEVRTAIRTGDAAALRRLLAEDPARADDLIRWGSDCRIATHPLHYVSDMLFNGVLERGGSCRWWTRWWRPGRMSTSGGTAGARRR